MIKPARQFLTVAALALVATLTLAVAPAGAQDYNNNPTCTVSPASASPGATVTVTCTGFDPGTSTSFITSTGVNIGTVVGGSVSYTIPANAACGSFNITGTGVAAGVSASASTTVTVVGCAVGGGTLPRTGSDNTSLVQAGIALLAVGGVLILFTRRRNGQPA